MAALRPLDDAGSALERLAEALATLDMGSGLPDLAAERERLIRVIRHYLIPRCADGSGPLTVVVTGPTGSGKSTLVNSLLETDLAPTGVIRPTTTDPLVVTTEEFVDDLAEIGGVRCRVIAASAPMLDTIALVDTPDIDSTSVEHRAVAERLIDLADVVVFVTSALRYADQVPWQVLRRAISRGAPVINVLNRVTPAVKGSIVDFRSRLRSAGLDNNVTVIPEHHIAATAGRIPTTAVGGLRSRLQGVVSGFATEKTTAFHRVLATTFSQATELARHVADLSDEYEDAQLEAAVFLVDRASRLSLHGVGRGLYPSPGGDASKSIRRWRRRAARAVESEEVVTRIKSRIFAIVTADLRLWLADEHRKGAFTGMSADRLTAAVEPTMDSAAEGWVSFARRVVAETPVKDKTLGLAVLLGAATSAEPVTAAGALFGDGAGIIVGRARRELTNRLEVVYEQAADLVFALSMESRGALDDAELRLALGAVSATLAPSHA